MYKKLKIIDTIINAIGLAALLIASILCLGVVIKFASWAILAIFTLYIKG